LRTKHKIWNN